MMKVLGADHSGSGDFVDGVDTIADLDLLARELWTTLPMVRLAVEGPPADLFFAGALYVCSARFRYAVEAVTDQQQVAFHPVDLRGAADYSTMQVLDHRPAIDLTTSRVEIGPDGWIEYIDSLTLHDLPDVAICRPNRCYEDLVIVGPEVASAVEGLRGVQLVEPAMWR